MSVNPSRRVVNQALGRLHQMTVNLLLSRSALMGGASLDPEGRNLAKECGWPEGEPPLSLYRELYDRVGPATRVVQVYPEESWSIYPDLFEIEDNRVTKFERAWKDFEFKHNPWHYLHRVDELSGIGRYGILVIGLEGDNDLSKPVFGIDDKGEKVGKSPEKLRKVAYLQTFPEHLVKVATKETRRGHPRYGQPVIYDVTVSDPNAEPTREDEIDSPATNDLKIHWTRVIHVADNRQSSEIYGTPRLKPVVDDILDIRKIKGSAAEMFYKGGFPGISFETYPELAASAEMDTESLKEEIEAYSKGLQRYMRLVGMSAKSLAPQVADPASHIISILQLVCTTIKVPLRVFMGTEAGHLASQMDSVTWNRRLRGRQIKYLDPMVIKPFVRRLMVIGVLPFTENYIIRWSDLNALSDTDKAKVSLQKAQAILQYVTSGSKVLIPPKMFLVHVLNFSDEEATAIVDAAGGEAKMMKEMKEMMQKNIRSTPAGSGTNPGNKTGAGGRRNGLGKAK